MLLLTVLLQGCGSSSNSTSTTPTPTPTPTPEPTAVHIIQPADIPQYIAKYKQQQTELIFEFDGNQFPIELIDFDQDENTLLIKSNAGNIVAGFDFSEEEPTENLNLINSANQLLTGSQITVTSEGENFIYSGRVVDQTTQGSYDVRLVINESLLNGGNSQFNISGSEAILTGELGTKTYIQMQQLISNNPEVNTITIHSVNGSVNDAINMHTGRLVRNAKLTTQIKSDGQAYSGGVDLFASGFKRIYEAGGKVGVHSWCCVDGKPANELGQSHSAHGAQLTYFREMLGTTKGPDFYFFTIQAAPFSGVHLMTVDEMNRFSLIKAE